MQFSTTAPSLYPRSPRLDPLARQSQRGPQCDRRLRARSRNGAAQCLPLRLERPLPAADRDLPGRAAAGGRAVARPQGRLPRLQSPRDDGPEAAPARRRLAGRIESRSSMTAAAPVIEASNLSKHFKTPDGKLVRAVDGVSFDVRRGETFALVGKAAAARPRPPNSSCTCSRAPAATSASRPPHLVARPPAALPAALCR